MDIKVKDFEIKKWDISNGTTGTAGFVMRKCSSESAAIQDIEKMIEQNICIFDVLEPGCVFPLLRY